MEVEKAEALALASKLLQSAEDERFRYVHELMHTRQLCQTVRQLNDLLEQPEHRSLGVQALKCIGFDERV